MDEARAACHDDPTAYRLAFSRSPVDSARMKAEYCSRCPIRLSCLAEALDHKYFGIWGGYTYKQRKELLAIQKMFNA